MFTTMALGHHKATNFSPAHCEENSGTPAGVEAVNVETSEQVSPAICQVDCPSVLYSMSWGSTLGSLEYQEGAQVNHVSLKKSPEHSEIM